MTGPLRELARSVLDHPIAGAPYRLTNALNTLMLHGQMSPDSRATLNNTLASMTGSTNQMRAQRAVYLIGSSSEYFVAR